MRRSIYTIGSLFFVLNFVSFALSDPSNNKAKPLTIPFQVNSETSRWSIKVTSIDYPKSVLEYAPTDEGTEGSGRIIEAPNNPTGAVSNFVAIKSDKTGQVYEFFGGELTPHPGKKLIVVTIEVQNISDSPQTFLVGDISFKRSNNEHTQFIAIGKADSPPFTKFKEVEQKSAKSRSFVLKPTEKEKFTYILGVDESEPPLRCSFQNGPWRQLGK